MINILFNVEIKNNNQSCLEKGSNYCFRPVRYLWNGKTVVIGIHNNKCFPSYPKEKKLTKIALMIALLIPGLFLGIITKAVASFSPTVNKHRISAKEYLEKVESLKIPQFADLHAKYTAEFTKS